MQSYYFRFDYLGVKMLTQNEIKYIRSLHSAHNAKKEGRFIAEGERMVNELLQAGMTPERLYVSAFIKLATKSHPNISTVSNEEMKRISALDNPSDVLAIFPRIYHAIQPLDSGTSLYLENIQDPGNLGTIIRTAAWFGIKQVLCSEDTVSIYNNKVLQATMGGIAYVPVAYINYDEVLLRAPRELQIVATSLNGSPLASVIFHKPTLLLFGNEGKGLSQHLLRKANLHVTIPKGEGGHGESLNVSSAVAILCAATVG